MRDPRYRIQEKNPKFEYRNLKWFAKLTILSQVEGQIQNSNIQNQTANHEEKLKNKEVRSKN